MAGYDIAKDIASMQSDFSYYQTTRKSLITNWMILCLLADNLMGIVLVYIQVEHTYKLLQSKGKNHRTVIELRTHFSYVVYL